MFKINVVFDWILYNDMPRSELIQDQFRSKQKS